MTIRQIGGDDGYSWCVLVDGRPQPGMNGLTRREAQYYAASKRKSLEDQRND